MIITRLSYTTKELRCKICEGETDFRVDEDPNDIESFILVPICLDKNCPNNKRPPCATDRSWMKEVNVPFSFLAEPQKTSVIDWIKKYLTNKPHELLSAYWLKHQQQKISGVYLTEEQMIEAMTICGFTLSPCSFKPYSNDSHKDVWYNVYLRKRPRTIV